MTSTRATHLPVSSIPVRGFGYNSPEAQNEKFRDETVAERFQYAMAHGLDPYEDEVPQCGRKHRHPGEQMIVVCTRPPHTGMHMAGTEEVICGAW